MERLIRHVSTLTDGDLARTSLEDIALCAAWFDSFDEQDPERMVNGDMRKQFDRWVKCVDPAEQDTEGYRQQPILRYLISCAVKSSLDGLSRDELDVLYFAYALALRSEQKEHFARPLQCIQPYLHQIRDLREVRRADPGLPSLSKRYRCYTSEALQELEARDMGSFAGLEMVHRGPTAYFNGSIKILGDVPDGVAVIAEGGSVFVNGSVYGKVAGNEHCEVWGNIAGVVVARQGEIHGAQVMSGATVISKEGQVRLSGGETPKCVFAGESISVAGDVFDGVWIGRNMQVEGKVAGGEVHVSQNLEAQRFERTTSRPLSVVLRRTLTCQDYGELMTQEAVKLMSNAFKIRELLDHQIQLLDMTEREADEYAGNVLVFLLGQDNSTKQLAEVQQLRRRAAYLDRILSVANVLGNSIEDRMTMAMSEMDSANNSKPLLESLNNELDELTREGDIGQEFFEIRDELSFLSNHLSRRALTSDRFRELLTEVRTLTDRASSKYSVLVQNIDIKEGVLEKSLGKREILERAREAKERYDVMEQVLKVGMSRPGNNEFRRKATERYVGLMKRYIENRFARVGMYKRNIGEHESRIMAIRDQLWNEYNISLPLHVISDEVQNSAEIKGEFGEGVMICAWKHLLKDSMASSKGILYTPESGEGVLTYTRTTTGDVKHTAGQPTGLDTEEGAESAMIEG